MYSWGMRSSANLLTGSTKCTQFSWWFSEWALITFKCTKTLPTRAVPGFWEHAGSCLRYTHTPNSVALWPQLRGQPRTSLARHTAHQCTELHKLGSGFIKKAFITNLPCLKQKLTQKNTSLSFKLSHNSVLWASILPKLKLYSTSVTELQTLHVNLDASCGSVWEDYVQRLRPAAGLKIMIPIYKTTYSSDFICYPQKKQNHFKWPAKSCQHTSVCYCGLSLFSLLWFVTVSGRMRRWQQRMAEVTSIKGQSWLWSSEGKFHLTSLTGCLPGSLCPIFLPKE